jgi:uncharacterized membrane protein YsdA (DUF1294 family)
MERVICEWYEEVFEEGILALLFEELSAEEMVLVIGVNILSFLFLYLFLYIIFRILRCKPLTARWNAIGIALACFFGVGIVMALYKFTPIPMFQLNKISLEEELKIQFAAIIISLNLVVIPFLYWLDKGKAVEGSGSRIPESVLHFFSFLGGGAGAMISQRVFNHKTAKQPFRRVFWLSYFCSLMIYTLIMHAFGVVQLQGLLAWMSQ